MLSLVDVIIAILLFAAFQLGRRRGFAWQFAGLASLVLGALAARRFGPRLAAYFGASEGLRSVLAWAAIYAIVASLVHILVARWRAWLQKKDLEELDSHLGGWIGAIKGAVILAVILLFTMTLSDGVTQLVLRSLSGRALARLAPLVQDYLPPETSRRLAPYIPEIQPPALPAPPPSRSGPPTRPGSQGQGGSIAPPPKPENPLGAGRPVRSGGAAAGPESGSKSLANKPPESPHKAPPPAPRKEDGSEGDDEGTAEPAPSGPVDPYGYKPLRPLDESGAAPRR